MNSHTLRVLPVPITSSPASSTATSERKARGVPSANDLLADNSLSCQVYVIGETSNEEALLAQSSATVLTAGVSRSSDKRRTTHNEVERRRRDTINSWILKLGNLIPDVMNPELDAPKSNMLSKGGILARACDYLTELRKDNRELNERLRDTDAFEEENDRLRSQVKLLEQENDFLRQRLKTNGIVLTDYDEGGSSGSEDQKGGGVMLV